MVVWPRCGASATSPTTAAATTPSQAARYRSVSRCMNDLLLESWLVVYGAARFPGGLQMLAGDRREGAAPSQVHRGPVLALHAVHVTRAPEGVGEKQPDRGRAGRHVGGPAQMRRPLPPRGPRRGARSPGPSRTRAPAARAAPRPARGAGPPRPVRGPRRRGRDSSARALAGRRHDRAGQRAGRRQVLLVRDERGSRSTSPWARHAPIPSASAVTVAASAPTATIRPSHRRPRPRFVLTSWKRSPPT